jgi:thiol-disulfide isomerase/thioredoxin
MYWPDHEFRQRSKRRSLLGTTLLSALLIGLIFAGVINGWWKLSPSADNAQVTTSAVDTDLEQVAPPPTVMPVPTATPPPDIALAFALPDLFDDQIIHSLADYNGRPIILNFWASWCAPCRAEMPALQRAYIENRENELVVLGINQTFVDDMVLAREFVKELALTFPSVRDDDGKISTELYRVIGLPTSVFITPEGEIAFVKIGQMTDGQIDTLTQQLIANETLGPGK